MRIRCWFAFKLCHEHCFFNLFDGVRRSAPSAGEEFDKAVERFRVLEAATGGAGWGGVSFGGSKGAEKIAWGKMRRNRPGSVFWPVILCRRCFRSGGSRVGALQDPP